MSEQLYEVHLTRRATSRWRSDITDWLQDMDRSKDLVSMYLIGHPLTPDMVVVVRSRITAIMLKLALTACQKPI